MGPGAGIDLFFLPCLLIGALLFGPGERWLSAAFTAAAVALYFLFLRTHTFTPLLSPRDAHALHGLNSASAITLTIFIVFALTQAIRAPAHGERADRR
jgi:hypothetical protein